MAVAAARVAVDLLDEFADAVFAIADDVRRFAAGGGDQPMADHQQAEIMPRQVLFHHHLGTDFTRGGIGGQHPLPGLDVGGHAFALVAIARLDHHRAAQFTGRRPGVLGIRHRAPLGHRHPGRVQQILGQFLVLGDRFAQSRWCCPFPRLGCAVVCCPSRTGPGCLR